MRRVPQTRGVSGRGAHSSYETLAKGLGYFSIALGLGELLGAGSLGRALGLGDRVGLIRAYGVREIATGVSILTSHDPTPWIFGRVAGDALDLGTLAGAADPQNEQQRSDLAFATTVVAAVTVIDVICAVGLAGEKRLSASHVFDYADRVGFPRTPQAMRGAASDFKVPDAFRVPDLLQPWAADDVEGRFA